MTTATFSDALLGEATSGGSTAWFSVLTRSLNKTPLSAYEKAIMEMTETAAHKFGAPLLRATSRDELADRLEQTAEEPDLHCFNADAVRACTLEALVAATSAPQQAPPEMVRLLGSGPAAIVASSGRLTAVLSSVSVQLIVEHGGLAVATAEEPLIWRQPGLHSTIKRCALRGAISSVAFLGIALAMFRESVIEPWLSLELAETYHDGLYELLRLVSALPVHVPESVLPRADRLDLVRLQREVAEAGARWNDLLAQAGTDEVSLCEVAGD